MAKKKRDKTQQPAREPNEDSPLRDPNVQILIAVAVLFLVLAPIIVWLFRAYS